MLLLLVLLHRELRTGAVVLSQLNMVDVAAVKVSFLVASLMCFPASQRHKRCGLV